MGVNKLGPSDPNAPRQGAGGAARSGHHIPNWSLLRGRVPPPPVDPAMRQRLAEIFFPDDAVSVDISSSSPLPFADELRHMFSVYAEKQVEFRSFLRDVFHIDECVSAADSAFAASLPALDPAQNSPLCEEGGCGHLLQSDVTTPTVMIQFDPTVGRDPESFLDAASLSAIAVVVSKFEPPPAIRHFLLPPPDQQLPKRISLKALKSLASCSGSQQLPAQEFLENFQGLWDLVGDDFVEPAQLRQLLVQAAVKLYIERKLNHAKATLDEHAHLKFVVGRRYHCEWPSTEPMDASVPAAPNPMQECVLVAHLDNEYEVELVADQSRRRVRVKTLTALPVGPVDDCDWSDEAYARDSAKVLAVIAADFPGFQMLHRMPEPQHRTAWPIKFYFPGTLNVRSKMDFDEVDYGIFFAPFVSEAMLPSLTGDQREWLMKTAVTRETNRCFWLHMGVLLGVHPIAMQASCRDRCTVLSAKIADLEARDAFEDCQFFSEPIRSVLRRRGDVNSSGQYENNFVDAQFLCACWPPEMDNVRLIIIVCVDGWISMHHWNLFTPRMRERASEPWEGRDIILKLEHGHFTILEPHDKTLEHPIDFLLQMMKREGFDSPGELGPFCHLESDLGMPADETRCASAAQLHEQIRRL